MTAVDLITGFLGAGKTTFMKIYVRYLMDNGHKVCILENDFGAVNVDTMLLRELSDDGCGIEMVSGACDKDCHIRRFKTKLIAMAMSGYDRVVIEPSGVFDVDEFLDTLREPPLDRMYKKGAIITIADPTLTDLSDHSEYLLASQAAVAGTILFSRIERSEKEAEPTLQRLKAAMERIRCDRDPFSYYMAKPWSELTKDDLRSISESGCKEADFVKLYGENDGYNSVYFMNIDPTVSKLKAIAKTIFEDASCGTIIRIKGFTKENDRWFEVNASRYDTSISPIAAGQSIVIVIGEALDKQRISEYFK